ncbi:MAG: M14 family zinc carboxypeptidase [Tahibacter sp.]
MRLSLLAMALLAVGTPLAPGMASDFAAASREVAEIHYRNEAMIGQLAERFTHMRVDRTKQVVTVDVGKTDRAWLDTLGVVVEQNKAATDEINLQGVGESLKSIPGYSCYRTVEETQTSMDALIAAHPNLASKIDIGDSWEKLTPGGNAGYDLTVLKLTNSAIAGTKPKMFMMTAIHAREYTTAELNTRFAEWLVNNYGIDAEATWLLDHNEFHLLLQSNPDGRKQAETGLSWRKNTDRTNGLCSSDATSNGIDLNRNFPFHWGGAGASTSVCNETFRGPSGGSEPETQAVVNYVQSIYPDLRPDDLTTPAPDTTQGLFLDIHSYSQLVLWPWGDTTGLAPNGAALEFLGRRMAWFNGYDPQQSIGLYPTTGTTDDSAYGPLGVPAYTIELGVAFFENCASFESSTFPKNFATLRYAARTLNQPYKLPFGPDITAISVSPDLAVAGETVTLHATVDDTGLNRTAQPQAGAPPIPTTQNVAGAVAYADLLPWESGAVGLAMSAGDGSFNSGSEIAQLSFPTNGLSSGKHIIYVQGSDANGAKGPPKAIYVEIAHANEIATVHGTVRDATTLLPVAASIQIGTSVLSTDAGGVYSQRLHPGAVDMQVSAPGHMTEHLTAMNLAGGDDLQRDFVLASSCALFQDNVEGINPGWSAQSPWGIVNNVGGNASKVWTDSPSGNYANNLNTSLTSPLLNLSGYDEAVLRFDHKCKTESGYDYGHVEISVNGGATTPTYSEVLRCSGQTTWQSSAISLPQLDNQAAVRLRWRLTSDSGATDEGWSIDNVRLEAGGTACRAQGDLIFRDGFN